MTKAQAMKRARAEWGKTGSGYHNPRGCTKAEREEAREGLRAHLAAKPDPVTREWRQQRDQFPTNSYRYTVGRVEMGLFFLICGQGDSWAEAWANAEERGYAKKKATA